MDNNIGMVKLAVIVFLISVLVLYALVFSEEQITITTYYPSPYGSYNELQLYPHAATSTTCNANTRGTMYYCLAGGANCPTDDNIVVCGNGNIWYPLASGLGYWDAITGRPDDIHNLNPGLIGINTTLPSNTLSVFGNVGIGGNNYAGYAAPADSLIVGGRVGINTFTPSASYRLHVVGDVLIDGNLVVTGTLTKGGGSFIIDHPLDPKNKFLMHSFVESPDMKNIYDGVAILNDNGECTVNLPGYFQALNENFRYQLTSMGGPAMLYVKEEINDNQFVIAGGNPGLKVSWQVTGIRKDAFAKKHPIIVEQEKGVGRIVDKGKYLSPESFDN